MLTPNDTGTTRKISFHIVPVSFSASFDDFLKPVEHKIQDFVLYRY